MTKIISKQDESSRNQVNSNIPQNTLSDEMEN